ncbi:MAG: hypothetical protein HZA19_05900 [Nitrospirae bacterium]|nr:hypothetical protein [Nitrospirota bacterium]
MERFFTWVLKQAKTHPYITVVFAFWAFGYTFMVPAIFGGKLILTVAHLLGDTPQAIFWGFGFLFLSVFLFALVVPFGLWLLICWALEESGQNE